jgi:hypothetical protein
MDGSNINYSITYSLDGRENVTISVVVEGHSMPFQVTVSGFATHPKLSEGLHKVMVYSELISLILASTAHITQNILLQTIMQSISP